MERPIIPRRAVVNSPTIYSSPSSTYNMFIKTHLQRSTSTPGTTMENMAMKSMETQFWQDRHRSNNFEYFKSKCSTIIRSKIIRVRRTCISLKVPGSQKDMLIVEEVAQMIWITRISTVNTVWGSFDNSSNNQVLTDNTEESKAWHS